MKDPWVTHPGPFTANNPVVTSCFFFSIITTPITINGSMSVSEQLHTYPSPNQTTVNQYHIRVNVGLGEG